MVEPGGPSPHLTWAELACKDEARTPYPAEWRAAPDRLPRLVEAFEALRALVGAPLVVDSGYRTPAHNASVPRAAKRSQHMEGRALDLVPPDGWTVARLREAAESIDLITGIGTYATFLHIDVRPGRRVRWWGSRVRADV